MPALSSYNTLKKSKFFYHFTGLTADTFEVLYKDILGGDKMCRHLKLKFSNKTPKKPSVSMLSPKDRLLMSLTRLRRGWDLKSLGYCFGVSMSVASTTVYVFTQLMYFQMKNFEEQMFLTRFQQPTSEKPACFKPFKNLRVIIDTTEVRIEVPQNYEQQGNTYSTYKAGCVILYLIAISCGGTIAFISPGFEGNASDRKIYLRSGIRDYLVPGDAVMMDRGFGVDDEMAEDRTTCIRPPFLKGRDSLTEEEDMLTKQIAAARIHVERTIRRLKCFKILKNVTNKMLPILDQTVYVPVW